MANQPPPNALFKRLAETLCNLFKLADAVDLPNNALSFVMREDRFGHRLIFFNTSFDDLFGVVLALYHLRSTAATTGAISGGRIIAHVIGLSTVKTNSSPNDPLNDGLDGHIEGDNTIDLASKRGEQLVKRFRLSDRAGEAVKDGPTLGIVLGEALLDELDHKLIGNQLPGAHELIEALTEIGSRRALGAHHVARGDLGRVQLLGEEFCLRALTRTGRSEEEKIHYAFLSRIRGPRLAARPS